MGKERRRPSAEKVLAVIRAAEQSAQATKRRAAVAKGKATRKANKEKEKAEMAKMACDPNRRH